MEAVGGSTHDAAGQLWLRNAEPQCRREQFLGSKQALVKWVQPEQVQLSALLVRFFQYVNLKEGGFCCCCCCFQKKIMEKRQIQEELKKEVKKDTKAVGTQNTQSRGHIIVALYIDAAVIHGGLELEQKRRL